VNEGSKGVKGVDSGGRKEGSRGGEDKFFLLFQIYVISSPSSLYLCDIIR
jgi:hypothetical protein